VDLLAVPVRFSSQKTIAGFFTDGRYTSQAHDEVKGSEGGSLRSSPPLLAAAKWVTTNRKSLGRKGALEAWD